MPAYRRDRCQVSGIRCQQKKHFILKLGTWNLEPKMTWTFPLALTFLTICPWPRVLLAGPQELARSMFWFPWVGALLGLAYWGAFQGLIILFPAAAVSALLLALTVLATRGLHLDGLADTLDGLAGGSTPEVRLAIMKDSRLGTFGAVGLILVLLLKFAFFLNIAGEGQVNALLLFPVLSRWGMVLLAYLSPYARPEGGLGQAMTAGVSRNTALGATLTALILTLIISGFPGLYLLAGVGMLVTFLRRYSCRKIGGITGDVLGAANEFGETLVLGGVLLL
jgi:adenosylcobinamide-GDP ribazoletransferase